MSNRIDPLGVTVTVPRQTPKNEFGDMLKSTLQQGSKIISGSLLNSVPGVGALSAAVSAVTGLSSGAAGSVQSAATAAQGVVAVGGGRTPAPTSSQQVTAGLDASGMGSMGEYMHQMRSEADRSLMIQLQMQNESREYNTVSNVLKVRHDSAKAAINNIR